MTLIDDVPDEDDWRCDDPDCECQGYDDVEQLFTAIDATFAPQESE